MALTIRFTRAGTNKKPFFHIVVCEKGSPRDGKYLERLGSFNPKAKDKKAALHVDRERVELWQKKGALLSETVGQLLKATAQ